MHDFKLTVEDGEITWIETMDTEGNSLSGNLYIPKEATSFSGEAWLNLLSADLMGIRVHEDNPRYSSAHNCLLTKDGKKLLRVSQASEIYKLEELKEIGRDAFQRLNQGYGDFVFFIPEGVKVLDYRAFALAGEQVEITVPASVLYVELLAFLIHSSHTHIIFEGDPQLCIGAFGTAAEAQDSGYDVYRSMPAALYVKPENITVTCQPNSQVAEYCREYNIPMGA